MGKLTKVLLLINLLNHRHHVTLETITKTLKIPDRTAYRYLNEISEANIPVYFDKELRAYRLTQRGGKGVDGLLVEEALLLVVALKALAGQLNSEYRNEIGKLVEKLMGHQVFPVEEILHTFEHQIESMSDVEDCSDLMSRILINAAIVCKRKVRLVTEDSDANLTHVDVENPSLWFNKNWQLVGSANSNSTRATISEIKKVSVL